MLIKIDKIIYLVVKIFKLNLKKKKFKFCIKDKFYCRN